uniref:Odorant receptor n=1 Tax=Chouioia cunea TaxID=1570515 RepID=A0A6B9CQ39_9HYME|nr:odorant receptor 81 [Chouioia cunea]
MLSVQKRVNLIIISLKVLGYDPSSVNRKWRVSTFLWWFYLLNNVILLLLTIFTMFSAISDADKDIMTMSLTTIELRTFTELVTILLNYKYKINQFRILIQLMKNDVNDKTFTVGSKHVIKYVKISFLILALYLIVIYVYINNFEWQNDKKSLSTAIYPFKLDSTLKKLLILTHQLVILVHSSSTFIFDGIIALLIYTCTVRLIILKDNLKTSKDSKFKQLIHEHQEILKLIDSVNDFISYLVAKTAFSFVSSAISAFVQLIQQKSLKGMALEYLIVVAFGLRILVCAESAEDLAVCNENIQNEIYSSLWSTKNRGIVVSKLIMMRRCQGIPKICIKGTFISTLNREYIKHILKTIFLYFVAMRAIMSR